VYHHHATSSCWGISEATSSCLTSMQLRGAKEPESTFNPLFCWF
jgi:hypothetical protein